LASLPQPFFTSCEREKRANSQLLTARSSVAAASAHCTQSRSIWRLNISPLSTGCPRLLIRTRAAAFSAHYDEVLPDQIRPEEVVLVWQAASAAADLVSTLFEYMMKFLDRLVGGCQMAMNDADQNCVDACKVNKVVHENQDVFTIWAFPSHAV
jgi:hypothetical protein